MSPMTAVVRFGKKGKLSPHYVGTYEIMQRVCKVSYELKLPSELDLVHRVPCLKSSLVIPSLLFLLRVLVSMITSPIRKFQLKFLIEKSSS